MDSLRIYNLINGSFRKARIGFYSLPGKLYEKVSYLQNQTFMAAIIKGTDKCV